MVWELGCGLLKRMQTCDALHSESEGGYVDPEMSSQYVAKTDW